MRQLSKRQKKAIESWLNKRTEQGLETYTIDQMDTTQANSILMMNDHETFWMNADRYLTDLIMEKIYG